MINGEVLKYIGTIDSNNPKMIVGISGTHKERRLGEVHTHRAYLKWGNSE